MTSIPKIEAEALNLNVYRKYPAGIITPDMLGDQTIVRGIDSSNRPFVAVKVNLINCNTNKTVTQVVELVFKRYSIEYDEKKKKKKKKITAFLDVIMSPP